MSEVGWFTQIINTLHGTDYSTNQSRAKTFLEYYIKYFNMYNNTSFEFDYIAEKLGGDSFLESWGRVLVDKNVGLNDSGANELINFAKRTTLISSSELFTWASGNKATTLQEVKEGAAAGVGKAVSIFYWVFALLVVVLLFKALDFAKSFSPRSA